MKECKAELSEAGWSEQQAADLHCLKAELNATYFSTLLEATFVPAVLSLSAGDVTELKLFVAAAQAAHAQNIALEALSDELSNYPSQSAGRPLADEEVALRQTWISLVYLSLEAEWGTPGSAGASRCAVCDASCKTCDTSAQQRRQR